MILSMTKEERILDDIVNLAKKLGKQKVMVSLLNQNVAITTAMLLVNGRYGAKPRALLYNVLSTILADAAEQAS
jgi:hypothetical protein